MSLRWPLTKNDELLVDCASDTAIEEDGVVTWRRAWDEGIRRVEAGIVSVAKNLAVKFIGAGLGEDFDPTVAQFVVFGGKRILVDADFANRRLGRKLARGETVDIHLSAVRSGGGSGQSLQIGLQFVGIIGQSFQFLA